MTVFFLTSFRRKEKNMFSYKRSALLLKVLVATTVTLVLGLVAVSIFYSTWMRNTGPDFPDKMEGEAVIPSEASGMEVYHVKVDFNKKLVQFSLSENTSSGIVAPKIVVHDYNAVRKYPANKIRFDRLLIRKFKIPYLFYCTSKTISSINRNHYHFLKFNRCINCMLYFSLIIAKG